MANFTYFIRERVKISGRERGTSHETTLTGINYADSRIMYIPSGTMTEVINMAALPGAGTFPSSSLQYARISNMSAGPINLQISASSATYNFLVSGSGSFVISTALATSAFNNFTYGDIRSIKASPVDTTAVLEYFVATT